MRSQQSKFYMVALALAMMVLILDARTAMNGAAEAVRLCLSTIVPSLFPFFVITILLTGMIASCHFPILAPLGKRLRLPQNGEMVLLMGFLGGYPMGAQCIRQLYNAGQLSKKGAERMLAFCSNAGPAFIFGIGATIFPKAWMCWMVWLIQILSALVVGWLTPDWDEGGEICLRPSKVSITEAVVSALRIMATVCGWIVLFRVVLAFLERWALWILPQSLAIYLAGLFELSNGCMLLPQVETVAIRFYLFSVMLAGGGFCVAMQTQAVLHGSGLSLRPYLAGKVVQCAVCSLLCILFGMQHTPHSIGLWIIAGISLLICLAYGIYGRILKKDIAFRNVLVYNRSKSPGGSTYEAVS